MTRPAPFLLLAFVVCLAPLGCDTKAPPGAQSSTSDTSPSTPASSPKDAAKSDKSNTASDPGKTAVEASNDTAPKVNLDRKELPSELLTPAYRYYGLGNSKPIDMILENSSDRSKSTGSSSIELNSVKNGEATFTVSRTGALQTVLGDDVMVLKKDGLYGKGNSLGTLSHEAMELPADPKPGKTWTASYDFTKGSQEAGQSVTYKVIGVTSVTTKAGTFNGLEVDGHGTMTEQGKSGELSVKGWYVEGIGLVKQVLTVTPKGQKTVTLTVEATSVGKGAKS